MRLFDDPAVDKRFNRMQWRMLFATMIGYTLFYFMRKNFSFAMPGLEQDCGISKAMLGNFLFAGGIVYGISKFVNGIVGDKVNPRKMLCFGLLTCTLINLAFGFAPQIAAWFGGGTRSCASAAGGTQFIASAPVIRGVYGISSTSGMWHAALTSRIAFDTPSAPGGWISSTVASSVPALSATASPGSR
jgi:Sugar phosphate permease